MNDRIIISKLNDQIKTLTSDLKKKKKYISNLELSFIELQNKFAELRSKYFLSSSKEIEYQKMQIIYSDKDLLISELEKELASLRRKYENEQRLFNARYQPSFKNFLIERSLHFYINIKYFSTFKCSF